MAEVVRYALDDGSVVLFEADLPEEFAQASTDRVIGRVQAAVGPAVRAAREVLDRVKAVAPDEVEVTFGIKVSGKADWLVAKAATEGNFEITLRWQPGARPADEAGGEASGP